jgi:hypothetical protein
VTGPEVERPGDWEPTDDDWREADEWSTREDRPLVVPGALGGGDDGWLTTGGSSRRSPRRSGTTWSVSWSAYSGPGATDDPEGGTTLVDPQRMLAAALGGKVEPTAALRTAATTMYAMFQAYVDAGFKRNEALELIKATVAATVAAGVRDQK